MNALVVYDSIYGNTKAIAEAIGGAIPGGTRVQSVSQVSDSELQSLDLLIVGAPTHGGRPTEAMQGFLDRIPAGAVHGTRVAVFDTRLTTKLVRIFGYAAPKIADSLRAKGAIAVGSPEGFFVKGRKGPLTEGETECAARWAGEIVGSAT